MIKTPMGTMVLYSELWGMWQYELAKFIKTIFYMSNSEYDHMAEYNLKMACKIWKERFYNYPTIEEVDTLSKVISDERIQTSDI